MCMLNIHETSAVMKCSPMHQRGAHVIICLKRGSQDFVLTVHTEQLSKLDTPHCLFVCPLSLHAFPVHKYSKPEDTNSPPTPGDAGGGKFNIPFV